MKESGVMFNNSENDEEYNSRTNSKQRNLFRKKGSLHNPARRSYNKEQKNIEIELQKVKKIQKENQKKKEKEFKNKLRGVRTKNKKSKHLEMENNRFTKVKSKKENNNKKKINKLGLKDDLPLMNKSSFYLESNINFNINEKLKDKKENKQFDKEDFLINNLEHFELLTSQLKREIITNSQFMRGIKALFEFIQVLLSLLSCILYVVNTYLNPSYKTNFSISETQVSFLQTAEYIITGAFTLDYIINFALAKKKLEFIFKIVYLIDLCAILPVYLQLFYVVEQLSFLHVLQIFRIIRIFRIWRFLFRVKLVLIRNKEKTGNQVEIKRQIPLKIFIKQLLKLLFILYPLYLYMQELCSNLILF